ncbi:MAG: hypothetical protein ACFFAE_15785, partial [Candidatus Hodarchaeota archaeon]
MSRTKKHELSTTKSTSIGLILGFNQFKRAKSSSFFLLSAIVLSITFTLGIAIGTKYLQTSIVLSDLNDVITDIDIGIILPKKVDRLELYDIKDDLNQLSSVDYSVINQRVDSRYSEIEGLIHRFGIAKNSLSNYQNISQLKPTLLSFNGTDFKIYTKKSNIVMLKEDDSLLTPNKTIISSYLARKL